MLAARLELYLLYNSTWSSNDYPPLVIYLLNDFLLDGNKSIHGACNMQQRTSQPKVMSQLVCCSNDIIICVLALRDGASYICFQKVNYYFSDNVSTIRFQENFSRKLCSLIRSFVFLIVNTLLWKNSKNFKSKYLQTTFMFNKNNLVLLYWI